MVTWRVISWWVHPTLNLLLVCDYIVQLAYPFMSYLGTPRLISLRVSITSNSLSRLGAKLSLVLTYVDLIRYSLLWGLEIMLRSNIATTNWFENIYQLKQFGKYSPVLNIWPNPVLVTSAHYWWTRVNVQTRTKWGTGSTNLSKSKQKTKSLPEHKGIAISTEVYLG